MGASSCRGGDSLGGERSRSPCEHRVLKGMPMVAGIARRLVRTALVLAALAAVLGAAGWAVLQLPQFGAPMSGARLERAKANPQYRDGRFVNLEPEAPSGLASLGSYVVRQFQGHE